jgi:colanic acid/amylovoran biosynthesis glycosyltransferase
MTWLSRIANGLSSSTDQLILCEKTTKEQTSSSANIKSFENLGYLNRTFQRVGRKSGMFRTFPFYTNGLRSHRSQLLHAHFGHIGVEGCKIAESVDIPCIVSFYGMDIRHVPQSDPRWLNRYRWMFTRVKAVLCEGPYMATEIEKLGCPTEKIIVYPLGIDLNQIVFKPFNWQPGTPVKILMAASFREKKGLSVAFKALAALKDELNFNVTVVGDAGNDEASKLEKRRILDAVNNGDLGSRVTFTGYLSHQAVMDLAQSHHVFMSPSVHASDGDSEGGAPVAIIEMAAAGLTVISTSHCDIPQVVLNGKTGWLAKEGSVPDLIETIRMAVNSRDHWHAMAEAGRKHVEQNFNVDTQIKTLHDIYGSIING